MRLHRTMTVTVVAFSALLAAACGGGTDASAIGGGVQTTQCTDQAIVDAANREGQVNLIALPDTWANYKGILEAFGEKFPEIAHPVANPDASSADELTAVETLAGQPDQPDAVDVSPAIAQEFAAKGLWAPYKPCTWEEIPDVLKDPNGDWVAAYYGLMAIGANTAIVADVPTTFADLKKPEYRGMVTINGDPREAGAAFAAVMAAALANGGSFDNIMPGIQYFADLKRLGNLNTADVTAAAVLSGDVALWLDWTYNYPGLKPDLDANGITLAIGVPTDGVYGGYYVLGAVKDSPNPNAAKVWLDHAVSDEGALGYLEGGAIPARFDALVAAGKVSDEMMRNLPDPALIAQIAFPTASQIAAAQEALATYWGPMVADV